MSQKKSKTKSRPRSRKLFGDFEPLGMYLQFLPGINGEDCCYIQFEPERESDRKRVEIIGSWLIEVIAAATELEATPEVCPYRLID